MSNDCLLCRVARGDHATPGGFLLETPDWVVVHFMPQKGSYPGRIMGVTKAHRPTIADLTDEEARSMGEVARRASQAVQSVLNPARLYMVSFNEGVRHVHFHLLARPDAEKVTGPALISAIFDRQDGGWPEAEAIADKLKHHLNI